MSSSSTSSATISTFNFSGDGVSVSSIKYKSGSRPQVASASMKSSSNSPSVNDNSLESGSGKADPSGSLETPSFNGTTSRPQIYQDPEDIDDEVWTNGNIKSKTKTEFKREKESKRLKGTMRISITAGWDKTRWEESDVKDFIKDIIQYWGDVSFDVNGVIYSLELNIELVGGYNPVLRSGGKGDINFLGCSQCDGPTNSAKAQRGGHAIFVRENKHSGVIAHEFGHILGLGHRKNNTRSIQSYNMNDWEVTEHDLLQIFKHYSSR